MERTNPKMERTGENQERTAYQVLRERYPQVISKEQLCAICHVSKRLAKDYLDAGLIRCHNSGKATHKYTIRLEDVIRFLILREEDPQAVREALKTGRKLSRLPQITYDQQTLSIFSELIMMELSAYPDLMDADMIAEVTGYTNETVYHWMNAGRLRFLLDVQRCLVPKEYLMEYMLSEDFRGIVPKSQQHRGMMMRLAKMRGKKVEG